MRLRIMSDLHEEFEAWTPRIMPNEHEQILILGGDIGLPAITPRMEQFLEEMSDRFHKVCWILGNHSLYHSSIADSKKWAKGFEDDFDNLHVLDDEVLQILGGPRIFGGTLFTNLNNEDPMAMAAAHMGMNDYRCIDDFIPEDSIALHKKTLEAMIASNADIIVTHHAPSFKSIHPKYKGDVLNYAFASDLDHVIEEVGAALWVHGHVHHSVDFKIGHTRVIANPKGYHSENKMFSDTLVIEV